LGRLFETLSAAAARAKQIDAPRATRRRIEITLEREVVTVLESLAPEIQHKPCEKQTNQ
jgi:hypothetical protein